MSSFGSTFKAEHEVVGISLDEVLLPVNPNQTNYLGLIGKFHT